MDNQVNDNQEERLVSLIEHIEEKLKSNQRCLLAIEGRAAAGKTTMAAFLKEQFDAAVIHMDHFFLPLELRTPMRYAQPGGNVHYERFNEEIAKQIDWQRAFYYQCFNCQKMQLDRWQRVEPKKMVIIEGTYAMHPEIKMCYDVSLFMNVTPKEQEKRILHRNGAQQLRGFLDKWIPLEENYFKSYEIHKQCDLILNIEDLE